MEESDGEHGKKVFSVMFRSNRRSANYVKKEAEKRRYKDESINLDSIDGGVSSIQSKEEIQAATRNENFCQLFQLPLTETLLYGIPIQLLLAYSQNSL